MKSRVTRHLAVVGVFALISSMTMVVLGSTVASAQSNTYDCLNPFDQSHFDIGVDVTGDAAPDPTVIPGTTTVDNLQLTGTFPGSLVQLGITGGAISYGQALNLNTFIEIEGTNVAEGPVQTAVLTASPVVTYNGGQTSLPAPPGAVADDVVFNISYSDSFVFTPQTAGTASFSVTLVDIVLPALLNFHLACDGVAPITAFASVGVEAAPSPPTAADDVASVNAGESVVVSVLGNDNDPNGDIDPTTVTITSPASDGTATANPDGTITYQNTNTSPTTDTFQYTVDDDANSGPSNAATVTVTIVPQEPPTAVDDAANIAAGGTLPIDVLANDTDPNGDIDPTTVTIASAASEGTATANPDGTITYTHGGGSATSDTFTYTVDDDAGNGPSNEATVTVAIAQPGAPVAVDDTATVVAGDSVDVDVLANDTDPDDDIDPSTVAVVTDPTAGTATVNPDGTITYENTDDTATSDSFTYAVDDDGGRMSNIATVAITIAPGQTTVSGSATNKNACFSAASGDYTAYDVTIASDAYPFPHLGDPIELSNTQLTLMFKGTFIGIGYNAGIINNGDAVQISVDLTMLGVGTTQGSHTYPTQTESFLVNVSDPDGTPGTGDESSPDVPVVFDLPDTTWTPVADDTDVFFFQGAFSYSTMVSGFNLVFQCAVGTPVDTDGNGTNDSYTPGTVKPFLAIPASGTEVGTPPTVLGDTLVLGTSTTNPAAGTGETEYAGALAFTGNRAMLLWWALGGALLAEAGFLLLSATRPARVRRLQRKA